MSKVAIIGTGFIGRAWAISYARAGHSITLWDEDAAAPGKALSYIEKLLPDLEAQDLLTGGTAAETRKRMRGVGALEEALADVDYVQANTPQDSARQHDTLL